MIAQQVIDFINSSSTSFYSSYQTATGKNRWSWQSSAHFFPSLYNYTYVVGFLSENLKLLLYDIVMNVVEN